MPNLSIHTFTPATEVIHPDANAKQPNFYTVKTSRGDIRACAVFHATNGWANNLLPTLRARETGVFPTKAHVMAIMHSNPNPPRPLKISMGYDEVLHWMAPQPSGVLIYGYSGHGEIEAEYDDTNTVPPNHPKRKVMAEFLPTAFPNNFPTVDLSRDVKYDWTGIFVVHQDWLQYSWPPRP